MGWKHLFRHHGAYLDSGDFWLRRVARGAVIILVMLAMALVAIAFLIEPKQRNKS